MNAASTSLNMSYFSHDGRVDASFINFPANRDALTDTQEAPRHKGSGSRSLLNAYSCGAHDAAPKPCLLVDEFTHSGRIECAWLNEDRLEPRLRFGLRHGGDD